MSREEVSAAAEEEEEEPGDKEEAPPAVVAALFPLAFVGEVAELLEPARSRCEHISPSSLRISLHFFCAMNLRRVNLILMNCNLSCVSGSTADSLSVLGGMKRDKSERSVEKDLSGFICAAPLLAGVERSRLFASSAAFSNVLDEVSSSSESANA